MSMKKYLMQNNLNQNTYLFDKIWTVRNVQVILDEDLAILYKVETKVLNQSLKRNVSRFPKEFCFRLTKSEYLDLRSQIVTSNRGGRRYFPNAFTEQGVAMLSAVLKSETAIKVSIQIMNAFVNMRKHINNYALLYQKVNDVEKEQIQFAISTDKRFDQVFNALTASDSIPKQKIFYDGQVFDAHILVSDIIRSAKKEIILIDNYIDDTVLTLFIKRRKNVKARIYCNNITSQISNDIQKYNLQYEPIEIKEFKLSHDRFLIIDKQKIFHFGASLKDLGKKWFAVSKIDESAISLISKIKSI
ncbi:ORF6N domain-containing protein [Candidatus Shapirobacteria bacterium]|nr:ORF6N domain-containing protein [Candidatus Shapirobacteria bacterium]